MKKSWTSSMKKIFKPRRCCSPAPMRSGSPTSLLITIFIMLATPGFSQGAEMADAMRSDGKIYVVVSIMAVVLAGLISYLVFIDRKTSRLEQKLEEKNPS